MGCLGKLFPVLSSCLISGKHLRDGMGCSSVFYLCCCTLRGFLCQQWWLVIALSLPLIKAEDRLRCCWSLEVFLTSCHSAMHSDLPPCTVSPRAFIQHATILEFPHSILVISIQHINWSWAIPSMHICNLFSCLSISYQLEITTQG